MEHTEALKEVLRPHRLALNLSKSESLVAVRGCGPIKQSVKYLGAHVDAQLSLRREITKHIAAARNTFSLFARFSKTLTFHNFTRLGVFKAVINDVLLSALEVRALSTADARGSSLPGI